MANPKIQRMKDYLSADDLNTEGVLRLVETILADAANAYIHAKYYADRNPNDDRAKGNLALARAFYKSEYFKVLSMGTVDGETVMARLDRDYTREAGEDPVHGVPGLAGREGG